MPAQKRRIAVIPGDGIGKEVVPEGVRVLEAAAKRFGGTGSRLGVGAPKGYFSRLFFD